MVSRLKTSNILISVLCFSYNTYSQLYAWLWVGQVESAGLLFKCGRDGVTGPRFGPVVTTLSVAFIPLFEKEPRQSSGKCHLTAARKALGAVRTVRSHRTPILSRDNVVLAAAMHLQCSYEQLQ